MQQRMGRGQGVERTTRIKSTLSVKSKTMAGELNFKIQQVAVDLVVNVRIIFLLAQVQAWDVHRGLERETKRLLVSV